MARATTEASVRESDVVCGNNVPDNQTIFYHDILWKTYDTLWKQFITLYIDYATDADQFEPGDVVYCWTRDPGLARHYAFCTAPYQLVHVKYNTVIMTDSRYWEDVGCVAPFRIANEYTIDNSKAIKLAKKMVGNIVCYDVNTCNAEHFVMFWINNDPCTNQSKHCPNKTCFKSFKNVKHKVYKTFDYLS